MILERLWWGLVRFGFRLLYNELAFTYDLVSWAVSLGQWRAWQRTALRHLYPDVPLGAAVLEVAHGTGDLQIDLHAAGWRAAGLDRSPYMGRIAGRKLRRHGLAAPLARADALALPFASARFAAVVSTFPAPFILEPRALCEVSRVLCPGGRLVIVASSRLTGRGVLARLLEIAYDITGQRGPWPVDALMARFAQAGLAAEVITERLAASEVALIVAHKARA